MTKRKKTSEDNPKRSLVFLTVSLLMLIAFLTAYSVLRKAPKQAIVLLSFDVEPVDGPDSPIVLANILEKNNITATFFITGKYAELYPDTVKRLASQNHEIACHTYDHPNLRKLTKEEQRAEIVKARNILEEASGKEGEIKGFRAPYNLLNKDTLDVLEEEGFLYDASMISGWRWFYPSMKQSNMTEMMVSSFKGIPLEDVVWLYYVGGLGKSPFFFILRNRKSGVDSYLFHPHHIVKEKQRFEQLVEYLKQQDVVFSSHIEVTSVREAKHLYSSIPTIIHNPILISNKMP